VKSVKNIYGNTPNDLKGHVEMKREAKDALVLHICIRMYENTGSNWSIMSINIKKFGFLVKKNQKEEFQFRACPSAICFSNGSEAVPTQSQDLLIVEQ
jgi:hypothetical protein